MEIESSPLFYGRDSYPSCDVPCHGGMTVIGRWMISGVRRYITHPRRLAPRWKKRPPARCTWRGSFIFPRDPENYQSRCFSYNRVARLSRIFHHRALFLHLIPSGIVEHRVVVTFRLKLSTSNAFKGEGTWMYRVKSNQLSLYRFRPLALSNISSGQERERHSLLWNSSSREFLGYGGNVFIVERAFSLKERKAAR